MGIGAEFLFRKDGRRDTRLSEGPGLGEMKVRFAERRQGAQEWYVARVTKGTGGLTMVQPVLATDSVGCKKGVVI